MKKLITIRTTVILGAALAAGATAGTAAEAALPAHVRTVPGVTQVLSSAVALWFAEKLDGVISDEEETKVEAED